MSTTIRTTNKELNGELVELLEQRPDDYMLVKELIEAMAAHDEEAVERAEAAIDEAHPGLVDQVRERCGR